MPFEGFDVAASPRGVTPVRYTPKSEGAAFERGSGHYTPKGSSVMDGFRVVELPLDDKVLMWPRARKA